VGRVKLGVPEICYINGRFLSQEATGVQRYAEELVRTLDVMIDSGEIADGRFVILAPKNVKQKLDLRHIPVKLVGLFSGHLWEQVELPRYARCGFLINLCNTAPLAQRRQIVTIHDAGVHALPGSYSFLFRLWYRILLSRLGKTASQILTVSDFSRDELGRHIGISPDKIRAIHHGSDHIAAAAAEDYIIERAGLAGRPFLLAASSINLRKNFQGLLLALELLGPVDFDIVIAGGINPRVFGEMTIRIPENIRRLGYVTNGELKSLYRHATAFIYPSFYEGFGLPPLEAMACGCPVIVSDIPPHHEVCGEAALYCDPYNINDIADKISRTMNDSDLRRQLSALGLKRAENFNWRKSAGEFYDIVKELAL